MTDFHALDPQTRTVALVGTFLQHWSTLERALNRALAKALDLSDLQAAIVKSNVQLRDKIHILRTIVNMLPGLLGAKADEPLTEISNLSSTRNMMAHDGFGPSEDGTAVEFYITKAKGKFEIPNTIWTVEQFQDSYSKIMNLMMQVDILTLSLSASALSKVLGQINPPPTGGLFGLADLGRQPLPLQEHHTSDNDPANPRILFGTPPLPPEESQE